MPVADSSAFAFFSSSLDRALDEHHQGLMRGGEPGTLPREPFRPALGVCWGDIQWHDPASRLEVGVTLRKSGLRQPPV